MRPLLTLTGVVQDGKKRGKELGFPTINFPVATDSPEGIFVSQTTFDDQIFNSLTFIGAAKTFNENLFQAETYLLNFNQDIYGKKITVHVLKKLRDNQKFDSQEALIKQMEIDKKQAEEFFATL